MKLLAVAVAGRGLVDPHAPVFGADDEALLRGRAVFETARVYGGRPFRLDAHLDRLAASAARLGLPPVDRDALVLAAEEALDAAGEPDAVLRLLWTPGRRSRLWQQHWRPDRRGAGLCGKACPANHRGVVVTLSALSRHTSARISPIRSPRGGGWARLN